ncbi:unnamed protein product [Brachionus calyciflorus]|uniref:Uncharacterized protein n=1 Tax=Brachionus calyciflorus TaxID=104777 RepID=A0A813Z850_9BILA|nr:unnamed protein product [Brachionus calyciflorus]
MSNDIEFMYASVKCLIFTLKSNREIDKEMDRVHGFQLLAMLFKRKKNLINSKTLGKIVNGSQTKSTNASSVSFQNEQFQKSNFSHDTQLTLTHLILPLFIKAFSQSSLSEINDKFGDVGEFCFACSRLLVNEIMIDFEVENYLSDACFRDFPLNSENLFKSLKPDYLNHNFDAQNLRDLSKRVKFGCNLRNYGITNNENQCKKEKNVYDEKFNYCENNSTCFNKWFNYECENLTLPFYGKNCQFGM